MAYLVTGLVLAVCVVGYYYNGLVRLRNQGNESWSGIDVQLKRRYDLVPNLVEAVKGYAGHEKEVLQRLVEARNSAVACSNVEERAKAEDSLTGAFRSIFALSEAYPDLKASEGFRDLQKSLIEVEDHIQLARRYYNAVVRDLNTACESFPSVIVASLFGFKQRQFFQIEESERAAVSVKL